MTTALSRVPAQRRGNDYSQDMANRMLARQNGAGLQPLMGTQMPHYQSREAQQLQQMLNQHRQAYAQLAAKMGPTQVGMSPFSPQAGFPFNPMMAYPTVALETPRPDLADTLFDYSFAYAQMGYVAYEIFPLTPVPQQFGWWPRVTAKEMLRKPGVSTGPRGFQLARAPGSAYVRDDQKFGRETFLLQEHGIEETVDEHERNVYAQTFEHEAFAVARGMHRVMEQAEIRVSELAGNPANYDAGEQNAVTNSWTSAANATPTVDVLNARIAMFANCGFYPDSMVMSQETFYYLRETDAVRERIRAEGAGDPDRNALIGRQQLAQIFDIPNIYIAGGVEDATNPAAAFTPTHIWPDDSVCLYKRVQTNNPREIGFGRTFVWEGDVARPQSGLVTASRADNRLRGFVEQYYETQIRQHVYRMRHETQEKALHYPCAFLLTNVNP